LKNAFLKFRVGKMKFQPCCPPGKTLLAASGKSTSWYVNSSYFMLIELGEQVQMI